MRKYLPQAALAVLYTTFGSCDVGASQSPPSAAQNPALQANYSQKSEKGGVGPATADEIKQVPAGTAHYAIRISGPTESVKYQSRLPLHIEMINLSSSPIVVHSASFNYDVEVLGSDGKVVNPEFIPYGGSVSGIFLTIRPGDKLTTDDALPIGYRSAMQPGKYSIRLTFDRHPKDGKVDWSNKITVTVVP